ncbi:hypothetical protein [Synechococcus sp. JA-3-3Ab]|nr:hypothetical protein [Synechococcus sp. JA-3-3Ab]
MVVSRAMKGRSKMSRAMVVSRAMTMKSRAMTMKKKTKTTKCPKAEEQGR